MRTDRSLSVAEASAVTGVSQNTIRYWMAHGKIAVYRRRRTMRGLMAQQVRLSEVEQQMERMSQPCNPTGHAAAAHRLKADYWQEAIPRWRELGGPLVPEEDP